MWAGALQLPKGDPEQTAEKRALMHFREVEELSFGYRELVKINNLMGLDRLTKLRLDCNRITTIENLSHLVRQTLPVHGCCSGSLCDSYLLCTSSVT